MARTSKPIIDDNLKKKKPCYVLGYCPYGYIVEAFPLRESNHSIISCGIFGHDCPMFYFAEDLTHPLEKSRLKKKEI